MMGSTMDPPGLDKTYYNPGAVCVDDTLFVCAQRTQHRLQSGSSEKYCHDGVTANHRLIEDSREHTVLAL